MSHERIGASGRVTGPAELSGLLLGRARASAFATVARHLVNAKRAGVGVVDVDDLLDLIRVQGVEPEAFVDQRRAG